ncbi:UNVERIFIED_CONTAM: hypothetical protein NCL1_27181 [Trichonephila clavipes]
MGGRLNLDRSNKQRPLLHNRYSCHFNHESVTLSTRQPRPRGGCGSPVVKVSDHGWHVMSSSTVPLETRRVGQLCTLNLSRAETSSRGCGVVVRRRGLPAQVSSTSLDYGSKLRGPSPKTLE